MRSSQAPPGADHPGLARLHRPAVGATRPGRGDPARWGAPARGDMVIGAFVLARLLGLRLLTLEAQVVVHDGSRHPAGSGAAGLGPAPAGAARPPAIARRLSTAPAAPSARLRERPVPPARAGAGGGGSDPLARAVQLVEQGADTLERTRRGQYRG